MKALTIHQPWATALATGMKRFETRPRKTAHRGPIAIHAGKTFNEDGFAQVRHLPFHENLVLPLSRRWVALLEASDFPTGAVIAVGELTDCLLMDDALIAAQSPQELSLGDWQPGRYAYQYDNVRPVGPLAASGKQGFWEWDEEGLES